MATLKMRACLAAAQAIGDEDRDAVLERAAQYERDGIEPNKAARMAAADVLAELQRDRAEFEGLAREQHPQAFETPKPDTRAAKARARAKQRMLVNPETDSMLEALAKMGGIRRDVMAKEFGMKPEELKFMVVAGGLLQSPFRKNGGMDMDTALTSLQEAGYFMGVADEDIRTTFEEAAYAEIGGDRRMTPQGIARQAERDAAEQAPEDPFDPVNTAPAFDDFTFDELEASGYAEADPEVKAAAQALLAEAEALGIDTEALREDAARGIEDQSEDFYYARLQAITRDAIAAARRATGGTDAEAARGGAEDRGQAAGDEGGQEEGLTLSAQSAEDLKAKTDREAAAAEADKREQKRLADKAKADAQRDEFTLTGSDRAVDVAAAAGQGGLFDAAPEPAPAPAAPTEADALRTGLGDFTMQAMKLADMPGGTYVLLDGRTASYQNGQFNVAFSWGNGKWSAGDTHKTAGDAFRSALKAWTDRGNDAADFKPADKAMFVSGVQQEMGAAPKRAAKVTPQVPSASQLRGFIEIAADSVEKLREMDVDRVISETPVQFRLAVAMHIKEKRPGLAEAVDEALADATPSAEAEQQAPAITREQERALYDYLRQQVGDDALRYELIAKKIQRSAEGTASPEDEAVVRDWLKGMLDSGVAVAREAEQAKVDAAEAEKKAEAERKAMRAELQSGKAGNPRYQAFLDTLEQDQLDKLETNADYMAWINARVGEFTKANNIRGDIQDHNALSAYIRKWADDRLSERVKEQRAAMPVKERVEATKKPPESRIEAAKNVIRALYDGTATVEEYRAGYYAVRDGEAEVKAELGKLKKDELTQTFGIMRDGKKDELVGIAYKSLLRSFALGKEYGPRSYFMGQLATYEKQQAEALTALVDAQTADDLAAYAGERAKARQEREEQVTAARQSIENPKTLDDFRRFMGFHTRDGKTIRQARLMLSAEQRAEFDRMLSEESRNARKGRKEEARDVRTAGQTVGGTVIETKHTRDNYDLFVVQLADRVSKDDYGTLLGSAKKLGGWYSSFRGRGAVPGFQFKDRASADAFLKLAAGDKTAAQEVAATRRDAFDDDRSQTAVERLREMADAIEERAQESLDRERKTNTDRRARMAASAEAGARYGMAQAKTMRNLADAIEAGNAKMLDRVRQKVQVELLQSYVANARDTQLREKYPSYIDYERNKDAPPDADTAEYADFPTYTAYRSDLASLGRQLLDVDGTKLLGQRIMKMADDVSDAYLAFVKEPNTGNLMKVSPFGTKVGDDVKMATFPDRETAERSIRRSGLTGVAIVLPLKRGVNRIILSPSEATKRGIWKGDGDKRITLDPELGAELVEKIGRANRRGAKVSVPWQFESTFDRRQRLARMGIETGAEFRSALREFIALREQPQAPDRIKELERAMVGRRNDGMDFFPTPADTADAMIAAADLQPGMRVLEPSAGMGHIAEQIREAGVEPEVVEISNDRRELLEAKGFNVVGRDFLDVKEGGYDRILMNPPFSDGRDIEHVRHAYNLLKPGGRLVAIMGEGAFTQSFRRAAEFREWLETVGGTEEKLPEGTFLDPSLPVNTGANARMVVIEKVASTERLSVDDSPATPDTPPRGPATLADRTAVSALQSALRDTVPGLVLDAVAAPDGRADGQLPSVADRAFTAAGEVARRYFDKRLVLYRANKPFANGVHSGKQPGVIFLSANTSRPAMAVMGHEMLHAMRKDRPDLYDQLNARLSTVMRDPKLHGDLLNLKRRAKGWKDLDSDDLREELVADIVGDNFTDPEFWRLMAKDQPSGFRKIADAILKFLDDLISRMSSDGKRPFGTDQFLTDVQAARAAVVDAMRNYSGGEVGAVTADSDLKFSAADSRSEAMERGMGAPKAAAQDFVMTKGGVFDWNRIGETKQDRVRTVIDKSRPFYLGALTLDQIIDVYGKDIPQLADYGKLTRAMENERQKAAQEADALYNEWAKLDKDANDRLARVMLDATVYGVHPDRDSLPEDPSLEQRVAHARLRKQWEALPNDAKAMYAKVRDYHAATLSRLRQALEDRLARQVENAEARAATLTSIRMMFDRYLSGGPYFPLHRFGDYLVVARRDDGEKIVASYETAGEQQAAARAMAADGFKVKMKTAKEYSREQDSAAGKFIGDIIKAIDETDFDQGAETKAGLLDDLNQLFIRALPDLSYRKHFMHRKGTPGFSADVMRGFANSAFHSASHIARLDFADRMQAELDQVQDTIENVPEGDLNTASQVLNEVTKRHDAILNPKTHPVAALLNQVGFVMYLGASPAAGLVNLLQTPMVTLPYLGARHGFAAASGALTTAAADIMAAPWNKASGKDAAQSSKLTAAEKAMIRKLQEEGVIDLTQAADLAAATSLDTGSVARSKYAFAAAKAMRVIGWTFHVPEVMNRQATALAAFRLATEKGADAEAAADAAREAIRWTQFDYSGSNRARYMQGDVMRVITQFKQYAQNVTYFLGRALHQALAGETPEVRSIARKQFVATMATTFTMAGTLGLPGVGAAMGLIGMAIGAADDDDEPFDWKKEFRKAAADAFGKEAGEVLAHGIPRALLPVDIAGRVGLGELWFRDSNREGASPREAFAQDIANILGPTFGTALGWYTAADHMSRGNWDKAVEAIVPKAIRDPLKAVRYAQDGVTTYTGEPILQDLDSAELLGQLLGFTPADVSEVYEGRSAVKNREVALTEKRTVLLTRIAQARLSGDSQTALETAREIQGFNERNPEFRITSDQIAQSVRNRALRRREADDLGVYLPKNKRALSDEGRFAAVE